jgi:hypothetical protein
LFAANALQENKARNPALAVLAAFFSNELPRIEYRKASAPSWIQYSNH